MITTAAIETPSTSCDRIVRSPFELFANDNKETITNDSSNDKTPSRRHPSEYDEGMDCFQSPFRLSKNSSCSLIGAVLFNLGRVSHNEGHLDDALDLYKRSLLAIEHSCSCDGTLTLTVLVGVGKIQYVKSEHADSLNTYMTALTFAQSLFGEGSLEVAACLNCIGVLHYVMPTGDDDIALDALQTSLQQRLTLLAEDHIDVGTTCNNLGRLLFQLGKYDLAMEAYCDALRIRRKYQRDSIDVAATLFNCGQLYHNLEYRDRALSLFHEFLKIAKIHFGEFHRDICIVTTCIGQIFLEKKEYEKALKSFQHALRIGYVALGPAHSEVAITLNKMGNLYYETGNLESALKAYHQGLEIETAVLESGNTNTYVTYTNIAEIRKFTFEVPLFVRARVCVLRRISYSFSLGKFLLFILNRQAAGRV